MEQLTEKRFTMKGSTILECGEEITAWDCCDLLNELNDENEQLKKELQRIYDIATVNKVKNIVVEIYDDLLYENSDESDYARKEVLKCLEKIDDFGDDLND